MGQKFINISTPYHHHHKDFFKKNKKENNNEGVENVDKSFF